MPEGMRTIDAATLYAALFDESELAILDAREEGEFGASHLFWAVCCPLSRAELRAPALLPNRAARVVCVDGGGGEAERLADLLTAMGCGDVAVLEGGTPAWAAAGQVLFSGVNVPSKAFGEWVEHHYKTESIDAPQLKALLDGGRDMVVLDSRTFEEFRRMAIPGGVSVPGGELAYRIGEFAPDPETLVVVNCAGRTRSILGAESLRQAGIPNRVLALRNGTMGGELAGLVCAEGASARFHPGRPARADVALERARAFADRSGVGVIGPERLALFANDPRRTLYVLDVRDPAEFAHFHLEGSLSAPGGQLVQATDQWIAVRNARIALIDDDGARARMAGAWLRQMGHRDVFVVEGGLDGAPIPRPAAPAVPHATAIDVETLAAAPDALVVDLARSIDFRAGHIPGAVWGIRSRLAALADRLGAARLVVLTDADGSLTRSLGPWAWAEAQALTAAPVRVLAGGNAAWRAAGRALAADRTVPADEACVDFHLRPYDRNSGVEEAMRAYLSWEIDLVHEIRRDGSVRFGV